MPVLVTEVSASMSVRWRRWIYGSASFPATHRYAVTGTNGKTTSTHMLESVFRTGLGVKTGLIGTIQILIDGVGSFEDDHPGVSSRAFSADDYGSASGACGDGGVRTRLITTVSTA